MFTYLNQVENRKDYIPLLEEVILLQEPPIRVGTQYVEVSTIARQPLKTTYEVVELEPPKKIRVRTVKSVFPIEVLLQLEKTTKGTKASINLTFTLKGIYKLAAPLVEGIVQKQAQDILQRLKNICEADR